MRTSSAAVAVLLSTVVAAQSAGDRDVVLKVQDEVDDAFARRDAAAYTKLTTDDFIRVANGRAVPKAEWLKQAVGSGEPREKSLNDDVMVHVYPALAVSVSKNTGQPASGSGQQPGPNRLTRVYVKTAGRWLAAAAIGSPIRESAQQPANPTSTGAGVQPPVSNADIVDALSAIQRAVSGADVGAFDRLTAEDFIGVGATGTVVTKADRMKAIGQNTPNPTAFNAPDLQIHRYGDGAIAWWRNPGGGITLKALVRRNGTWLQVLNHNAPAGPSQPAR